MKPLILVLLLLFISCSHVVAQVVETSKGKVEFIGLEKWTPELIREKLEYKSPDNFHFCAADLKAKLNFADVSVTLDRENNRAYTIITVVEPEYARFVVFKPRPTGSVQIPESWQSLAQLIQERGILNEILDYGSTLKKSNKTEKALLVEADRAWWKLLQERRNKFDFQTALKVLSEDKEWKNRSAAALILTNFPEKDAAWQALLSGIRDKDARVNSASFQSLITLTKYVPRRVNWSPAAESIRHILNGTNLFALEHTIKALLKTNVSRKIGKDLLKNGGGRMLLAYLRANNEERKSLSHELLVRLSGKDLGYDKAKWSKWMETI